MLWVIHLAATATHNKITGLDFQPCFFPFGKGKNKYHALSFFRVNPTSVGKYSQQSRNNPTSVGQTKRFYALRYLPIYIIAFFFIKGGEKLKLFMYMIFVRLSLRLLLFFWQLDCQNIAADFNKCFWMFEFFQVLFQ